MVTKSRVLLEQYVGRRKRAEEEEEGVAVVVERAFAKTGLCLHLSVLGKAPFTAK